ncbi:MAG: class IV adenylate cyclase [Blastocatellia bacterium]|nr:class IV adenylate cyclase [Blastocatellia bacterium]
MANIETELKIFCDDFDLFTQNLKEIGFLFEVLQPRHFEDNWMFDTSDGALRTQKSALRLRLAEGKAIVTFKGSPLTPQASEFKTREELETEVTAPEITRLIFERLGFKPFFRYQKFRTTFRLTNPQTEQSLLLMRDESPLGNLVELEGEAQVLTHILARLAVEPGKRCTESYIALQHARCVAAGKPLEDLVFEA